MQHKAQQRVGSQSKLSSRSRFYLKMDAIQAQKQFEQSLCPHLKELNRVQNENKKMRKIPFLNLEGIKQNNRNKVISLGTKNKDRIETHRQRIRISDGSLSSYLNDTLGLRNRKSEILPNQIHQQLNFPPITSRGMTTPIEFLKSTYQPQNSTDTIKNKKSRGRVHCKVILQKNSNFPFLGINLQQSKRIDIFNTRVEQNAESFEFSHLDISRINQLEEPPSPSFISMQSYGEIQIS